MTISLIHDARQCITSIVRYERTEGRRTAKTLGYIKPRTAHKYNVAKEVRAGQETQKTGSDLTDIAVTAQVKYFYDQVLHRKYYIILNQRNYSEMTDKQRSELAKDMKLSSDDVAKITAEKERLERVWRESLDHVLEEGFKSETGIRVTARELSAEFKKPAV